MIDRFILMVYASRSGSTFLAKELTNNYDIVFTPETNFIPYILKNFKVIDNENFKSCIDGLFAERKFTDLHLREEELRIRLKDQLPLPVDKFILKILEVFSECNGKPSSIGIKKGNYLAFFDKLDQLFPENKYIGLIRDGRAVYASQKQNVHSETGMPFQTNPKAAAREWVAIVKKIRKIESTNKLMVVRYEDLLVDLPRKLNEIADFLDVNKLSSAKERYFLPQRYKVLHKNINDRPIKDRKDDWTTSLTEKEIATFEKIAFKTLIQEGYSPVIKKKSLFGGLW